MKCFCQRKPKESALDREPVVRVVVEKSSTSGFLSREVSVISAVSCLETQSTAVYSPRSAEDPILSKARERREVLEDYILDSARRFVAGDADSKGVQLWHFHPDKEPLVAKGHVAVEGVFDDLSLVLNCLTNVEKAKEWNTDIIEGHVIREILNTSQERLVHEYSAFKGRMGFPGRDFSWFSYTYWESRDVVFVLNFSSDVDDHNSSSRYVRAHAWITGYKLARTKSGISVHFVNQVDIGSKRVPDLIVNSILKRTPERLGVFSKYIQQHLDCRNR